jgi:hypothetical protein
MIILLAAASEIPGWVCKKQKQTQHRLIIGRYARMRNYK